ncbi:Calx-beta domain-containing protein, partial [Geminocystis sp. GBBB08]|uniref:beta strand repeat-containing protein n=1 Tax=Geminocystis sp. GBBB08 TaxID=2604140 RepID=UPI0027E37017
MFSDLVREIELTPSQLGAIKQEDDKASVVLNNQIIAIEQATDGDPQLEFEQSLSNIIPSRLIDGNGDGQPEGIIFGSDGRTRIINTTSFPFSSVGLITITMPNGGTITASGAMISPFHFLTAGHVITDDTPDSTDGNQQQITDGFIEISLGATGALRNGMPASQPYGRVGTQWLRTFNGWFNDRNFDWDIGLITLDRNVGDHTGWFGYGWNNNFADNTLVNNAGYPGDLRDSDGDGVSDNLDMIYQSGLITSTTTNLLLSTDLDNVQGNSGGPVWVYNPDTSARTIYGVTSYFERSGAHNGYSRITQSKFDAIKSWIQFDIANRKPQDKPDFADHDYWWGFNSSSFRNNNTSNSINDASNSFVNVNVGDSITFNARIRNNGTARVDGGLYLVEPTINVSFYASSNTTISSSDHKIGEANISAIDPFTQSYATLNTSFPNIPEGDYHVGYTFGSIMSEFDNNNNTGIIDGSMITVKHKRDLSGAYFEAKPDSLKAGDSFTVDFKVKNTEVGFINGFWVDFYLSTNSTISISDKFLGDFWVSNLSGNSTTTTLSKTLFLPSLSDSFWNATLGNYYIGMIVDSTNSVTETNESNNNSTGSLLDYDDVLISAKPTISIVATDSDAAETDSGSSSNTGTFTLTRTGNTNNPLTVFYSLFGTATNGIDYSLIDQFSITFPPNNSTTTINIAPIDDTDFESPETINIALSTDSNYIVGLDAQATINLVDNDLPPTNLAIAPTNANQTEGNSGTKAFTFTITRSVNTTDANNVNWAVTSSGANPANGADFVGGVLPTGTVSFASGETSKVITVNVQGDTTVEPDENFTVTLSNATNGATITTATAIGTIQNDDVSANLAIAPTNADQTEGNSGTKAFTFTVTRSGTTTGANNVNWAVTGSGTNPANATDFAGGILPTGTVSFASGETSKVITVNVQGDTTVEPNENFTLTLSNATNGATITTPTAIGTIQNDDIPQIIISPSQTIVEGLTSPQNLTYTVTLSQVSSQTVTVQYATANGTAIAGSDYTATSGTLTFSPGQISKTITIPILNDSVNEFDENFNLTLSNPSNANLSNSSVTITVTDTLFTDVTTTLPANVENLILTGTTAINGTGNALNNLITGNTGNNNLSGGDGNDTLLGGDGNDTLTGGVGNDSLTGGANNDFALYVGTFSQYQVTGSNGVYTITDLLSNRDGIDSLFDVENLIFSDRTILITDAVNPTTNLAIAATNADQTEGNSGTKAFTFTVTRSGTTTGANNVNWAVTGSGTNPANATDFAGGVLPTGTVSFAAGETSKVITVNVQGDTTVEPNKNFIVTLSNATNGATITTPTAIGTIQNDDVSANLAIAATNADQTEGNSGTKAFTFTVTRSGTTTGANNVNWAVTGSGTNPANATDFASGVLPTGTVSFAAGETSKVITVNVQGDTTVEPNKNFTVTLSNATNGATITTPTAIGTIQNDDGATSNTFSNTSPISIADFGSSTPYPSPITVSGLSGNISKVTVTLNNLSHTFPDDIDILLVSPTGAKTLLMSDVGGGSELTGVTLTFDPTATNSLPDENLITSGTYKPTDFDAFDGDLFDSPAPVGPYNADLSVFNNTNPNGVWSLYVIDDVSGDAGAISGGWSLTFETTTPLATNLAIAPTNANQTEGNSGTKAFTFTVTRSGTTTGANNVNWA